MCLVNTDPIWNCGVIFYSWKHFTVYRKILKLLQEKWKNVPLTFYNADHFQHKVTASQNSAFLRSAKMHSIHY